MWQLSPNVNENYHDLRQLIKERQNRLIEHEPAVRSIMTAHLDVQSWLDPLAMEHWSDLVPDLLSAGISHSLEQYINENMSLNVGLDLTSTHGSSQGNLALKVRNMLSTDVLLESSLGFGPNRHASYVVHRFWREHKLTTTLMAHFQVRGGVLLPTYTFGFSRVLLNSFNLSASIDSRLACFLDLSHDKFGIRLHGTRDRIVASVKHAIPLDDTTDLRLRLEAGPGLLTSVGLVRKFPALTGKLGVHLQGSTVDGIVLRVVLSRFDNQFVLPIHLSRELSIEALLVGSVVPSIVSYLAKAFVLEPLWRHQRQQQKERVIHDKLHFWQQKRDEAEIVQALLKERLTTMDGSSLLQISKAQYESDRFHLDVRCPLQVLVVNNQLHMMGPKYQFLGFYDVDPGQPKRLSIEYTFKGQQHAVSFDDLQDVHLPLRCHLQLPP
jgi:hypothetical protein